MSMRRSGTEASRSDRVFASATWSHGPPWVVIRAVMPSQGPRSPGRRSLGPARGPVVPRGEQGAGTRVGHEWGRVGIGQDTGRSQKSGVRHPLRSPTAPRNPRSRAARRPTLAFCWLVFVLVGACGVGFVGLVCEFRVGWVLTDTGGVRIVLPVATTGRGTRGHPGALPHGGGA
jgi:hypothetical protein